MIINLKQFAMRKTTIFKIAFSLVLIFAIISINAQENAPFTQMTATQAGAITPDSVTTGAFLPYYVEPDPVINNMTSAYDSNSTNAAQGINSTFNWYSTGNVTLQAPLGGGGADAPFRYARFGGSGTTGTIYVEEVSPGSCTGVQVTNNYEIIAAPDFTVGDGTDSIEMCASAGTYNLTMATMDIDANTTNNYVRLRFDYSVDTLDSDAQTILGNVRSANDTIVSIANPGASQTDVNILTGYPISAANGYITKYTFAFDNTLDATNQNGINDYISRKSDFLGLPTKAGTADSEYTFYAPSASASDVIIWMVYPTPTTGNIYYIPNSFDNDL